MFNQILKYPQKGKLSRELAAWPSHVADRCPCACASRLIVERIVAGARGPRGGNWWGFESPRKLKTRTGGFNSDLFTTPSLIGFLWALFSPKELPFVLYRYCKWSFPVSAVNQNRNGFIVLHFPLLELYWFKI